MNKMPAVNKIPVVQLSEETQRQAERNVARLDAKLDTRALKVAFMKVLELNIAPRAKMKRFFEAADALCEVVLPFSACTHGCSYCCNIAVTMTTTEAGIIGKHVGRKPKVLTDRPDIMGNIMKYNSTPCPFLKRGKCSIYEVRPVACRVHFNMADTPEACDTSTPAQTPMLNNNAIDAILFRAYRDEIWGDIRDFFPAKPA